MPNAIRQLLNRGYWEETDGGNAEGSAGGSPDDDTADSGNEPSSVEPTEKPAEPQKPSDSEAKLLKEVMSKKAKIKELESSLNDLQSNLKQFEGIDPEQVKSLLKEKEDAEKQKLEAKGEWETLKKRMAEEHKADKQKLSQQLEELSNALNQKTSLIEKLTLGHEFDNSKYIREELVLTPRKAKAIYGDYFSIDESGNIVGYDAPSNKEGRSMLVDASGDPLPFEQAVQRLIEADPDKDELLRSKRRPGAGSTTATNKGVKQEQRQLSAREKIELGLKSLK